MTPEEKAIAYDKAIEVAKRKICIDKAGMIDAFTPNDIYEMFHELAESEDERIREAQLNYWRSVGGKEWHGVPVQETIAWLEKQSEKPTNMIELRFNVGDWIIFDENHNSIYQVERIDNYRYQLRHYLGGTLSVHFDNKLIRQWTIQDAKDGDVLEFGDHGRLVTGILSFVNKTTGKVDVSCLLEGDKFKVGVFYNLDTVKPHPATKEQRDLLFQKMKEAGYQWDNEKKELRKIEQKSKWSEEDEDNLTMAIYFMRSENTPYSPTDVEPVVEWLCGLKQRMEEHLKHQK